MQEDYFSTVDKNPSSDRIPEEAQYSCIASSKLSQVYDDIGHDKSNPHHRSVQAEDVAPMYLKVNKRIKKSEKQKLDKENGASTKDCSEMYAVENESAKKKNPPKNPADKNAIVDHFAMNSNPEQDNALDEYALVDSGY